MPQFAGRAAETILNAATPDSTWTKSRPLPVPALPRFPKRGCDRFQHRAIQHAHPFWRAVSPGIGVGPAIDLLEGWEAFSFAVASGEGTITKVGLRDFSRARTHGSQRETLCSPPEVRRPPGCCSRTNRFFKNAVVRRLRSENITRAISPVKLRACGSLAIREDGVRLLANCRRRLPAPEDFNFAGSHVGKRPAEHGALAR